MYTTPITTAQNTKAYVLEIYGSIVTESEATVMLFHLSFLLSSVLVFYADEKEKIFPKQHPLTRVTRDIKLSYKN